MTARTPILVLSGVVLFLGAGCASSPGVPLGLATASYEASGYNWRDPLFYEPWYDPAAIVLPPPPPGARASGVKPGAATPESARVPELDYR